MIILLERNFQSLFLQNQHEHPDDIENDIARLLPSVDDHPKNRLRRCERRVDTRHALRLQQQVVRPDRRSGEFHRAVEAIARSTDAVDRAELRFQGQGMGETTMQGLLLRGERREEIRILQVETKAQANGDESEAEKVVDIVPRYSTPSKSLVDASKLGFHRRRKCYRSYL